MRITIAPELPHVPSNNEPWYYKPVFRTVEFEIEKEVFAKTGQVYYSLKSSYHNYRVLSRYYEHLSQRMKNRLIAKDIKSVYIEKSHCTLVGENNREYVGILRGAGYVN